MRCRSAPTQRVYGWGTWQVTSAAPGKHWNSRIKRKRDPRSLKVLEGILTPCRNPGLATVAEYQGDLFARPLRQALPAALSAPAPAGPSAS